MGKAKKHTGKGRRKQAEPTIVSKRSKKGKK